MKLYRIEDADMKCITDPDMERAPINQRPKQGLPTRLFHYTGTDLYQWFEKRAGYFEPVNIPFKMTVR